MYLIPPEQPQFKANLHCHSTLSDGRLTPEELVDAYRRQGYSVLAITDHETPCDHSDLTGEDFLLLTGYEAYIRPDPDCRYDLYAPEVHLNLFARNPHNETLICYNPACCKYITPEQQEALQKAGTQRTREYTTDYVNEFIRTAVDNGYLVSYNHPTWSMEDEERILSYDGCFSMEIMNGGSLEYNGQFYDASIRRGKRWFLHAGDDNHNRPPLDDPHTDSFLAATVILADSLCYGDVIDAMARGDMYATEGPLFEGLSFDGQNVHVRCSPVSLITCQFGGKAVHFRRAAEGETLTDATFTLPDSARYLRITLTDTRGCHADTRAYTREELNLPPL